jgi:hypothetical protein
VRLAETCRSLFQRDHLLRYPTLHLDRAKGNRYVDRIAICHRFGGSIAWVLDNWKWAHPRREVRTGLLLISIILTAIVDPPGLPIPELRFLYGLDLDAAVPVRCWVCGGYLFGKKVHLRLSRA